MGNIRILTRCWRLWYDIFCVHMYMKTMHTCFLGIYAFCKFTHAGNMKCMFGNLKIAKYFWLSIYSVYAYSLTYEIRPKHFNMPLHPFIYVCSMSMLYFRVASTQRNFDIWDTVLTLFITPLLSHFFSMYMKHAVPIFSKR
jgi:hypothetical protein